MPDIWASKSLVPSQCVLKNGHKKYHLKFTVKKPAYIGCICASVFSSSFSLHESGNSPRFSPHCPHPANLAFRPGIGKGKGGLALLETQNVLFNHTLT